jgi:hypothetical protein
VLVQREVEEVEEQEVLHLLLPQDQVEEHQVDQVLM